MQDSPAASVTRLKNLIDHINSQKRSLLRALTLSLNHYQKYQRKQFIESLSSRATSYSQASHHGNPRFECQVKRFCSKRTLDVGRALMKADPDSLGPEEYLWRQLKKRSLLSQTKLEQDFNIKFTRLNVPPKFFRVRETVKAMFMSFENDLKFIQRLRSFEEDSESYQYLRDKLRLDLDETRMSLDVEQLVVAEVKTQCSSKKFHDQEEDIRQNVCKRRKIDNGRDFIIITDQDSEIKHEETKDQVEEVPQ